MTNTPVVDLVRNALDFANRAAGEGIEIDGLSPEDFLMEYSVATGDEDWDTYPDRILAALTPVAASEPPDNCQQEEWSGSPCPDDPDNYWICDKTGERVPASAAPMTVEAAAQVLLDALKAFEGVPVCHMTEEQTNLFLLDRLALRALAAKGENK